MNTLTAPCQAIFRSLHTQTCLLLGLAWLPASAQVVTQGADRPTPVIAIDIGHSKATHGAISAYGKPEFEFNAALAMTIRDTLTGQGVGNTLINADGNMHGLVTRSAEAQTLGARFFLSVHHDSAKPHYLQKWRWKGVKRYFTDRFSGYSLFVSRKNPHIETSLQCAREIGHALQQAGLKPTPHHAANMAGERREWADRAAGVYYFDDLVVLKTATMPAMLLEAGVIVNRTDERKLQTPERQALVAQAVAAGLRSCGIGL